MFLLFALGFSAAFASSHASADVVYRVVTAEGEQVFSEGSRMESHGDRAPVPQERKSPERREVSSNSYAAPPDMPNPSKSFFPDALKLPGNAKESINDSDERRVRAKSDAQITASGDYKNVDERGMSFAEAKDFLRTKVFTPSSPAGIGDKDYYCGCSIIVKGKRLEVDMASCGYEVRRNPERAARIEWEHVVPASFYGKQRACWREGGRSNCTKNDSVFRAMEGDPYNLLPVVGEVNADRSALRYGMISGGDGQGYGKTCGSRVDFKQRVFMPRADVRGDVARINFYFQDRYGLAISRKDYQLFSAWAKQDPVDARECERVAKIKDKTGVDNPHVSTGCK